jgi:cytochrome P450
MWKFQRKLASHLFYGKNFREIICVVFEEETKKFLKIMEEKVNSGEVFDLQELFYRFTLDSFGKITFGLDFNCLTNLKNPVKFAADFDLAQTITNKRVTNPYLWRYNEMFTDEGRKMREACKYLSDFAYNIIKKRRNNPEYWKNPKDILNLFMNAEYENGEKLTDKELRDIILNLIIAGKNIFFF